MLLWLSWLSGKPSYSTKTTETILGTIWMASGSETDPLVQNLWWRPSRPGTVYESTGHGCGAESALSVARDVTPPNRGSWSAGAAARAPDIVQRPANASTGPSIRRIA